MKIATMATGGIGGYLAVCLSNAGHQVATIARGDHLEAIQKIGLTLEGFDGNHCIKPWIATSNPEDVGEVDALDSVAKSCVPMIGENTIVIPFLNGVEASDRLTKFLPAKNVGNGVALVSTTITEPGVIK